MSGYNVPRRREALVLLLVWSCYCVFFQSSLVGADLVSLPNVQRCASDAGTNKCRLCDPSLPSFMLDMTSPLKTYSHYVVCRPNASPFSHILAAGPAAPASFFFVSEQSIELFV